MVHYTKILFALDLQPDDDNPVSEKVELMAKTMGAVLHITHVVEQISYSYGEPFVSANYIDWQVELEETAKEALQKIGRHLGVPEERQHLRIGKPEDQILEVAEKIGADLVVVGSHGRHGLKKFLLGSTANGVLQRANCDVLAVRVKK